MRRAIKTLVILAVLLGALLPATADPAMAASGACSVREAHAAVHAAQRAVARAEARLREARHVESATRAAGRAYGNGVGRWVRLARQVGWPWAQVPSLAYCISGESGGNPAASNGICRGLLQIHECHATAFRTVTGLPYFNGVYVPRANLRYGLRLWRAEGWGPWVVMQ